METSIWSCTLCAFLSSLSLSTRYRYRVYPVSTTVSHESVSSYELSFKLPTNSDNRCLLQSLYRATVSSLCLTHAHTDMRNGALGSYLFSLRAYIICSYVIDDCRSVVPPEPRFQRKSSIKLARNATVLYSRWYFQLLFSVGAQSREIFLRARRQKRDGTPNGRFFGRKASVMRKVRR